MVGLAEVLWQVLCSPQTNCQNTWLKIFPYDPSHPIWPGSQKLAEFWNIPRIPPKDPRALSPPSGSACGSPAAAGGPGPRLAAGRTLPVGRAGVRGVGGGGGPSGPGPGDPGGGANGCAHKIRTLTFPH